MLGEYLEKGRIVTRVDGGSLKTFAGQNCRKKKGMKLIEYQIAKEKD